MQTFSALVVLVLALCGMFYGVVAQDASTDQMKAAIQSFIAQMDSGTLQQILTQYGTASGGPVPPGQNPGGPIIPASPQPSPQAQAQSTPAPSPSPPPPSPSPPPPSPSPPPASPQTKFVNPAPKPSTPSPTPAPAPAPAPAPSPAPTSSAATYGSWTQGTATYYTTPDNGSCGYGPLPNGNVKTGTNIAAISDQAPNYGAPSGGGYYKAGSCGICYEVQCVKAAYADGTGELVDSQNYCFSKTIVVTVTDTCPKDGNPKCGPTHLDLDQSAFVQIAQEVAGQVSIQYRQVDCSYSP